MISKVGGVRHYPQSRISSLNTLWQQLYPRDAEIQAGGSISTDACFSSCNALFAFALGLLPSL